MITHKMNEILAKEEQYEQIPTKKTILLPTFLCSFGLQGSWNSAVFFFTILQTTKLSKYILLKILLITLFLYVCITHLTQGFSKVPWTLYIANVLRICTVKLFT